MPVAEPKWVDLARKCDAMVDDVWGEPVRLLPWKAGKYKEGGPDEDRATVDAIGIQLDKTAIPATATPEMVARFLESDLSVSMRKEPMEYCGLRRDDRVNMLWREELYSVTYVDEQSTDRNYIHLVIIREPEE